MKISLFFILIVAGLTSCKKNKTAQIEFVFQTELNGSKFDMATSFSDSQNRAIRIELFKFYVANLSFIDEGGELQEVEEISLLDLGSSGYSTFSTSVPTGKYTGLSFGIGVPQYLNEQEPSNFSEADHPLSTTQATYWGMNGMYRFVMLDGRYDLEPDMTFDGTFSYHTGHKESYRTVEFVKDFEFEKDETYVINFGINISTLLEGGAGNLDIVGQPNYHGASGDLHLSTTLSDNFKTSISLK